MKTAIIDVREADEFEAEHAEGAILVPLSEFPKLAPNLLRRLDAEKIIMMCRSGNRAKLALELVQKMEGVPAAEIYPGGMMAWMQAGHATVRFKKTHFPIMRQVQAIAGALILLGVALALTVRPEFLYLSAFVGLGLFVAGTTGFCGMAILLSKAPWNQNAERGSS